MNFRRVLRGWKDDWLMSCFLTISTNLITWTFLNKLFKYLFKIFFRWLQYESYDFLAYNWCWSVIVKLEISSTSYIICYLLYENWCMQCIIIFQSIDALVKFYLKTQIKYLWIHRSNFLVYGYFSKHDYIQSNLMS